MLRKILTPKDSHYLPMKDSPVRSRTFDADGFILRAACLCFRDLGQDEVLLVSSNRYRDRWIVPGGGIEPFEDPAMAAIRESHEEAGVVGKVLSYLGVFENHEKKTRTSVFTMLVESLVDEYDDTQVGRQRKWFTVEEAKLELMNWRPFQRLYLEMAPRLPTSSKDRDQQPLQPPTLAGNII